MKVYGGQVTRSLFATLIFVVGFLAMHLVIFIPKAEAATFTVNSTGDASDATPGNGVCATAGAVCTLRAAIEESNAAAAADTINFGIAGTGVKTIVPDADLPEITRPVTINALTQTGASCGELVPTLPATSNTPHELMVEIDGINMTGDTSTGIFDLNAPTNSVTIRGFVLANQGVDGLRGISGTSNFPVQIDCNYIGTTSDGLSDNSPNDIIGIALGGSGVMTVENNLISGNGGVGMHIDGGGFRTIQNNLIGTDATGLVALGNGFDGLMTNSGSSGDIVMTSNVISGNGDYGISMVNPWSSVAMTGNYIGVGIDGSTAIGNATQGVYMTIGSDVTIGGAAAGEGNIISNNGDDGIDFSVDDGNTLSDVAVFGNTITNNGDNGIELHEYGEAGPGPDTIYDVFIGNSTAGTGNTITGNGGDGVKAYQNQYANVSRISVIGNSIYDNSGLGINLANDSDDDGNSDEDEGPNENDSTAINYTATRANHYMHYPTINNATVDGTTVTIDYDFDANTETLDELNEYIILGYRLDFYANDSDDASGYGEGKTHIGGFFVDGSETGATHEFTGVSGLDNAVNISATATFIYEYPEEGEPGPTYIPNQNWLSRVATSITGFFLPKAHADEIAEPDTYILGSTSEFSPYFDTTPDSDDPGEAAAESDSLADTGSAQSVHLLISLTILSFGVAIAMIKNRPYKQR